MPGLEFADSFCCKLAKWMPISWDCSGYWVRDSRWMAHNYRVDPLYLKNNLEESSMIPDFKNWEIALGRRLRCLKVWFVLRMYGVEGIQKHIRNHVDLAHHLETLLEEDGRFEIVAPVNLGLVCFRLKNSSNLMNERLNIAINSMRKIFATPATLDGKISLRIAICSRFADKSTIEKCFQEICDAHQSMQGKGRFYFTVRKITCFGLGGF